jgi:hypothetical protein
MPLYGCARPSFSAASDKRSSSAGGRGGGAGRDACESMGWTQISADIATVMAERTANLIIVFSVFYPHAFTHVHG